MNKHKKNILISIAIGTLLFFGIGVAIPKLTVRDTVQLTDEEKGCVQTSIKQQLDHPLQRLALALGKSAVVGKQGDGIIKPNTLIVESYTLFRIPLPVTYLFNRFTQQVICDWAATSENSTNPPILSDGTKVQGLGQFHASPIGNGVKAYQSERLGISFKYPTGYLLFEGKGEGVGGAEYYVITVAPEMYVREAIARIGGGEWPASMHLSFYHEPSLAVSNIMQLDYLENWIRTKSQSNFVPSDPAQEGILTPTEIAGIPALKYRVRGLYDSDYFVFTYGEWVVLASADDMGENTDRDFQVILDSLRFEQ